MDSDLYDEFGNYIGPDLESESEEEEYEAEIDVRFINSVVKFILTENTPMMC
jgi:116 kDa U5 small nuclear ribonucleoprotein component N-terminus